MTTATDKQDGNQVVIENNTGTVHIHNSSDTELLKEMIKNEQNLQQFHRESAEFIKKSVEAGIEIAKKSTEQKNWKCAKCEQPQPVKKKKK